MRWKYAQTFYAKWIPNECTITFDTDGGSEVPSITQEPGSTVESPEDPTKEGYTFIRWEPDVPSTMPEQDVTCTAIWDIDKYTITWNATGGSSTRIDTCEYGRQIDDLPVVTRNGCIFNGWFTEETGGT